jgi:hypothetical protein
VFIHACKRLLRGLSHYSRIYIGPLIHHLLEEKKISLNDEFSITDLSKADEQKVAEMIENNVIVIHKVRIYSLKMDQEAFIFIYALSEEEAIDFYTESFLKTPLNCHEYPLDFQLSRGNEFISFRDMKKEFESFPAIVGYFMRE